ncbi:hypothetical protein PAMC26510_05310 [Caballeronia sordidicola]|uniref:Uncharacterized protein n=1 Tax=Caballeronia sordidicola TaxID=196367 RepID=A0A242N8L3_CABSO|nr:hypothetical protein PAMC26510_05310 [Caballeronia sordidicola]
MFSQSTLVADSYVDRLIHIDGARRAVIQIRGSHETRAYRQFANWCAGFFSQRLCSIFERRAKNACRGEG